MSCALRSAYHLYSTATNAWGSKARIPVGERAFSVWSVTNRVRVCATPLVRFSV